MNKAARALLAALAILALPAPAAAQILLRDDVGRPVHAAKPATRIVTLAPFLTEYVVAAGAGDLLVGVAEKSEYRGETRRPARVGDVPSFIVQHLPTLKPDLVLAFMDDIRPDEVDLIASTGATVFVAGWRGVGGVLKLLAAIGSLTGRDVAAAMRQFEERVGQVGAANEGKRKLAVFVELWNRPLTTPGEKHFLNEALALCGADNIFKDQRGATAQVQWDQVERRDPVAIIGMGSASSEDEFRANWRLRPGMRAVREGRLHFLDAAPQEHPTPASAQQIARLCAEVDKVRAAVFRAR